MTPGTLHWMRKTLTLGFVTSTVYDRSHLATYAGIRFFVFFNDTATTEIYTLSLHDALPICIEILTKPGTDVLHGRGFLQGNDSRSEEHTSELQSRQYLVCRLLLEKKQE